MPKTVQSPSFEFKGHVTTLMTLQLLDADQEKFASQLYQRVMQAPNFFKNAPIIIDLKAIQGENKKLDLLQLFHVIKQSGLIPVGIRNGSSEHNDIAVKAGMGILSESDNKTERIQPSTTSFERVDKFINQPIRAGQQVAALQGDLIVLSTVNVGAEVLAHRHIHIYSSLRGRALAGVNGDKQARIFCHYFDAELVSIAGQYRINDDLKEEIRGKAVQIYLDNDKMKIQVLNNHWR
jgi:septum site-determining protein MinC